MRFSLAIVRHAPAFSVDAFVFDRQARRDKGVGLRLTVVMAVFRFTVNDIADPAFRNGGKQCFYLPLMRGVINAAKRLATGFGRCRFATLVRLLHQDRHFFDAGRYDALNAFRQQAFQHIPAQSQFFDFILRQADMRR